jgi:hypothetical protein
MFCRMSLTQTQKELLTSKSLLTTEATIRSYVSRFHRKFQQIVQQEKGENFISRLHRGKFHIIPWPVIESKRFYEMFGGLKLQLDRKPVIHKHAGAFVGDLKMLMAKLKVLVSPTWIDKFLIEYRQTTGEP